MLQISNIVFIDNPTILTKMAVLVDTNLCTAVFRHLCCSNNKKSFRIFNLKLQVILK